MASILKVNTIQDATNSTTAMTIDSSGRVTRSVLPAWRIGLSANLDVSSTGTDIAWDNTSSNGRFIQGGCSASSGIVTVPVAGVYQINTTCRINSVSANYIELYIKVNNSDDTYAYHIEGDPYSSYHSISVSEIFSLSANDNVRIRLYPGGDSSWTLHLLSNFSGVMIG
jgi:hypothetical protein